MLDLKRRAPDVRRFVATIEEWIIRTLAAFNVRGERRDDRIGVWVRRPDKGDGFEDKIAAIGIRVQRWVTLHGFALNIEPELSHFSGIVPCGVSDPRYGVTSLADLGVTASMPEVDMALRARSSRCSAPTIDDQAVGSTENNSSRRRSASSSSRAVALIDAVDARAGRTLIACCDHRGDDVRRPTNSASTAPSRRLRTQPCRPRSSAVYSVQARKPTPCTRPRIDDMPHHVHAKSPSLRVPAPSGRRGSQCCNEAM